MLLVFSCTRRGKLRLIIDARMVNLAYRAPPSVHLAGPEVLSDLGDLSSADDNTPYSTSLIDIKDCFHRLRMPDEMCRHFCMPGVYARDCGITHVDGLYVAPDTWLTPCCQCLPMGYSWSVHFSEDVAVTAVSSVPALTTSPPLSD